ncbi:MAG: exo-alpha-sialidase [Lachnospiraceae bacterium]|nr:exo-alpha-sialidase [Lachnospiraceae bacterium]
MSNYSEKQSKTIGKQVLFLQTSEENCRNGEGAFVRLKDNGILFAFSEFLKGTGRDHDEARVSGFVSYDEGETWGEKRVLFTKGEDAINIMSVSFLRLKNGSLAIFYGEKYKSSEGLITDKMYLRVSADEGKSWGEAVCCFPVDGYHVLNNDRVIRLAGGRILVPIAMHSLTGFQSGTRFSLPGSVAFSVSDDDGKSWRVIPTVIRSPFHDNVQLQEPGVYQHEDGKIWMWCRTKYGCQYMAFSEDDGETWSDLEPGLFFSSPTSPMQVKRAGNRTLAVFNPIPEYCGRDRAREPWGRTPLVCAVSTDDGKSHDGRSFGKLFYLEDDRTNGYCYPAIFAGEDYFLTAYYHSNDTGHCLDSTKILKVMYEELEKTEG